MLIDFCHHSVKARIKADKVSFDGYEVENLVSGNIDKKRKGFLSDHFIKPPVNITVQFPCNVCIYYIVVDPVIGQQKSCDLKIFTATEKMTNSWLYNTHSDKKVNTDGVMFNYVGSVTQNDPTMVCFINNQFKERNSWRVENVPDLKSYPSVSHLNARKQGGLLSASHVTVCLNRSKGGKSVALRKLEIWGIPAVKVPIAVQNTLRNTYIEAIEQKEVVPRKESHKVAKSSELSRSTNFDKTSDEMTRVFIDGVPIPDDFIDQITFDLMTVPVLLPCGKNIDQSTLDRFVNTEASWGRPPSDPFTSVVFTPSSSPTNNTSLKARIDNFVFKHSNSLKVPQTLGHSDVHRPKKSQIVASKLVSDHPSVESTGRYSTPESPEGKHYNHSANINNSLPSGDSNINEIQPVLSVTKDSSKNVHTSQSLCYKRKHTGNTLTNDKLNKRSATIKDDSCIDLTSDTESDRTIATKKQKLYSTDHDSDLTQSLDNALLSTLGSLPSFTKKKQKQSTFDSKSLDTHCCKCKLNLTKSDVIKYKIICGHYMCRLCLVQESSTLMCNICLTQCKSNEAVRMF